MTISLLPSNFSVGSFVEIYISPANALDPILAPWGPLWTSIWSTSKVVAIPPCPEKSISSIKRPTAEFGVLS